MTEKTVATTDVVPSHEAASMAEVQTKLSSFTTAPMVYSTFQTGDVESQKKLAMAVSDATPLNEFLGKPFHLKDFVVQATTMVDDETGEERGILRIILVTSEGKAYSCVSDGIFKILQTFAGIFGHPSEWPAEGIKMQGEERKGRRGFRYLTLKLL